MASPYSVDLRERVVASLREDGRSKKETARIFRVGRSTVYRWKRMADEGGSLEPESMGGRRFGITDSESLGVLSGLVDEAPDSLIPELQEAFEERTGRSTSTSAISRTLQKLGLRRKKKKLRATELNTKENQQKREEFINEMRHFDADKLVFVDETGSTISMTRAYGRARAGHPVVDDVPRNRGQVTSVLGALRLTGIEAVMTILGGTSQEVFDTYVEQVLVPTLKPDDLVIFDNAGGHKSAHTRELIEAAGANGKFLPPYSPDLNPIEEAWSKIKTLLRSAKARTHDALSEAIADAITKVSESDSRGWFEHAGYAVPA